MTFIPSPVIRRLLLAAAALAGAAAVILSLAPASHAAATARDGTYIVRPGDTYWSIAEREYGDGTQWETIAAQTGQVPEDLQVGTRIAIPAHSFDLRPWPNGPNQETSR